ncbi:MAG: hypothetical protein J7K81_00570 [Methanophagales archaeon]|nr:hypothetical protein [Methanophagales archaeon]
MNSYWYFKLFNSIKSEHEAEEFAKLELLSLFGQVEPIRNFVDKLMEEPLKEFTKEPFRIQDIITPELPYGMIQGYYGVRSDFINASDLVKRLAYTREIFMVVESAEEPQKLLSDVFPEGTIGKNVQIFKEKGYVLFRFITNQYFLEKSEYISKLSRNEAEVDRNVDILFSHLFKNYYRIPASSTLSIGKRLEDYFAIREELSLYLNHYMHPYKGKFHPKMVRALLNYIYPEEKGTVLDNFAGSGTLLVEAGYLGLNSLGVEINPLSVLMSNVKCQSIKIPSDKLRIAIRDYIEIVKVEVLYFEKVCSGQTLLYESKLDFAKIKDEAKQAIREMRDKNIELMSSVVEKIIIAREVLRSFDDDAIREFLLLSLSGAISDVARRTKNDFVDVLRARLKNLYLRIYLFHKLNDVLKIEVGDSQTYVADTRDIKAFERESVDGIVNSPPYSTALDYIKNDYPQLILLKLVNSMEELGRDMMGNSRINYDKNELIKLVRDSTKDPLKMPSSNPCTLSIAT